MAKRKATFVREIEEYVELHRDPNTGIAWVENGKTGGGHTCHPSIHHTGSLTGMRKQHWGDARVARSHGWIYNIDSLVGGEDKYDEIAAAECRCEACNERHKVEAMPQEKLEALFKPGELDEYFGTGWDIKHLQSLVLRRFRSGKLTLPE